MKKFLSIALALAMTLSLVVVGASAKSFTDNSKIKYNEAVDVVSACKIIDGYTDGSFNPANTLSRGAAAKIICNMILGPTTGNALGVSVAPFKDVSTKNVFAGYVAYCAQHNIINGYADKTFRPSGTVTGYQFLKMLLSALGYDGKIESFTGANWEVNVAKLASNIGLYSGNDSFAGTKAMTREEACLYAFNTLTSNMVKYANKGTDITINGVTITQGASDASFVTNTTAAASTYNNNADGITQFCEQFFSKLKLTSDTPDNFKRPAYTWKYNSATVGTYKETPVATFNGYTAASKVATALSGYTLNGKKVNNVDTYTANTVLATGVVYTNGATGTNLAVGATAAATIAATITGQTDTGMTVEVYADSNKVINQIVVVKYTAGTVSNAVTTSTGTTYTLTPFTGTSISKIDYVDNSSNTDTIVLNGKIAKGDIVTYVVDNGGVAHVYPTTMVSGAQSAVSTTDWTITVGGKTYDVASGVTGVAIGDYTNSTKTANYYLDQFGNVVATTASSSYTDYAYVVGTYGTVSGSVSGATPSAQVKVVLADGSVKTCTVKLTAVTSATAGAGYTYGGSAWSAVAGDYVIDGTKTVVFKSTETAATNGLEAQIASLKDNVLGYGLADTTISMNTLAAASTSMTSGSVYADTTVTNLSNGVVNVAGAHGETILCNNSTVFVIYNTTAGTAKVYTGTNSLPTTTLAGTKQVVMKASAANTGVASIVYLSTNTAVATDTSSYVYIDASSYSQQLNNGTNVYVYTGVKADGTKITLTNATSLSGVSGLYLYNTDNTIGSNVCTTSTTTASNYYVYGDPLTVTSNVVKVGSAYYNINGDTKVVYVKSTLADVNGNGGYVVLAAKNGTPSTTIATIYVTVAG